MYYDYCLLFQGILPYLLIPVFMGNSLAFINYTH